MTVPGKKMINDPLVSIVIPVYNGANYLAEAIDSALAQTYKNIEIIVINDGSNDKGATRDIAMRYGGKIRYYEKENGGVATALNYGVGEMKGEYFSWLSHDDVYLKIKLERQIAYLEKLDKKDVIIYSDFCYIDENSKFVDEYKVRHVVPSEFRLHFIMGGIIHGCTLLVPYTCFKDCGLFDPTLKTTQDYDLWFRFSEKFTFIHIAEVLIQSRRHDQQDTIKLNKLVKMECDNLSLHFIKSLKRREIESAYSKPVTLYYFDFAKSMAEQGFPKAMRYAFFAGVKNILGLRKTSLREFTSSLRQLSKEVYK